MSADSPRHTTGILLSDPDLRVDATVEWSAHGKDRWQERGNDVGYLRAWAQSKEVDYPDAHSGARGRYHEASDCVLIVKRLRRHSPRIGAEFVDKVISVIELGDRPDHQQQYVRDQVRGDQ